MNIDNHQVLIEEEAIVLYTTKFCPFCIEAKNLLVSKGAKFHEIAVDSQPEVRGMMTEAAGGRSSVPQIWIKGEHVGGFDELRGLDQAGKLDQLLN